MSERRNRLQELNPGNRDDLSTEQIIEIASGLSDGEGIQCSTAITPFMKLTILLDNKLAEKVGVEVQVRTPAYETMAHLQVGSIQIRTNWGMSPKPELSMHDVVALFQLDAAKWHLFGYNAFPRANYP